MTIVDLVGSAFKSLVRAGSRSILTMLGIVIGILSVILVLSIGEAAQRYIIDQISTFGSDLVQVANGPKEPSAGSTPTAFVKQTLTLKDYQALRREPWVKEIVAGVTLKDTVRVNGQDISASIAGTAPDELIIYGTRIARGQFFSETEVDGRARVAVLGATIARNAFGQEDPLGKSITFNKQSFRIIGVMELAGTKSFQDLDKRIYVPVSAAMDVYNRRFVQGISLKTDLALSDAIRRTEEFMRERHNISDPKDDDFHMQTQDDAIRNTQQITGILQILLASIAAISLVVGGIGIMNIMYVNVTERIHEIGLRKSIGAQKKHILGQFLVEAVMLTALGGCLGIIFGIGLTWLAIKIISSFQAGWTFGISGSGVALGLIVSTAIGLIFGYAPARRASGLRPMEALRHE
ncbi:ABC transporter permease [Patescibacteria group bacterium]|nr:ABC transporter permease [Patescibacteria group bacterium]